MAELHREIGRRRPFDEPSQEAFLALVRTSSILESELGGLLRAIGLSGPTYNVLRILRGSLAPAPDDSSGSSSASSLGAALEDGKSRPPVPLDQLDHAAANSPDNGTASPKSGGGGKEPGSETSDAARGEVTCGHITRHLISPVPDVTRLVDRLQKRGLVSRRRSAKDRRVVYVKITDEGLALLASLDEPIIEAHKALFAHLGEGETRTLIDILAKLREGIGKQARENA